MSIQRPPGPGTQGVRASRDTKGAPVRTAVVAPSRRQRGRVQRDLSYHKWVWLASGALAALAAIVLAAGWYVDNVAGANDTAATVYDQRITTGDVLAEMSKSLPALESQARIAIETQGEGASRAIAAQVDQQKRALPDQSLSALVQQAILQREADRREITVTPEDVSSRISKDVAEVVAFQTPQPTATATPEGQPAANPSASATAGTPTPVPTLEPGAEATALANQLSEVGLSDSRFRELIERDVLREKVQKAFEDSVPAVQEQVRARHILVASDTQANDVLGRLNQGEDFATVAKDLSTDTSNKDKGGDLGWFPRGVMAKEFEDAAFSLQPGQRSGVVQTSFGYHIIEVIERDPAREVPTDTLAQLRQQAYSQWMSDQRGSPDVKQELSPSEHDWLLRHIGVRP